MGKKTKSQLGLFALFLGVLGIIGFLLKGGNGLFLGSDNKAPLEKNTSEKVSPRMDEMTSQAQTHPAKRTPDISIQEKTQPSSQLTSDSNESLAVEAIPPTLAQVRDEIAANPHQTPAAILKFAATLGPKMKAALQSKAMGEQVFSELENCASHRSRAGGDSVLTVRVLCLKNAQYLAQSYPRFQTRYQRLLVEAGEEEKRLLNR